MNVEARIFFRRKLVVCMLVAALCLIGLVYSSSFQSKPQITPPIKTATSLGVAEIAKPFSYSAKQATASQPKMVIVSAEDIRVAPDKETLEVVAADKINARSAGNDASFRRPTNPDVVSARPGMLFLRQSLPTWGSSKSAAARQMLAASASQYLDTPFNALFASVFKHGSEEGMLAADAAKPRDSSVNPFSEAKQKAEAAAPPPAPVAAAPSPATPRETPPPADQSSKPTPSTPIGVQKPAPFDGPYTFVGDFAGNGTLSALSANRVDDGIFTFADGQKTFSLYINPSAVELQRAFAVEDMNGDGKMDLLVTSRAALFGALRVGDDNGNFALQDVFVTGYEPTVPVAGLLQGTNRDILTVDMRSGAVTTFRKQDRYTRVLGQNLINFLPDFVARVTEMASDSDRFFAAQSGKTFQAYQWQGDGTLAPSCDNIQPDSTITVFKDFLQEGAAGLLQVYQAGSNASALLTTSHGLSFNVANFRVSPRIFLAIGNFTKGGTLDVAVAYLLPNTPSN
jgi:hypothetical protein